MSQENNSSWFKVISPCPSPSVSLSPWLRFNHVIRGLVGVRRPAGLCFSGMWVFRFPRLHRAEITTNLTAENRTRQIPCTWVMQIRSQGTVWNLTGSGWGDLWDWSESVYVKRNMLSIFSSIMWSHNLRLLLRSHKIVLSSVTCHRSVCSVLISNGVAIVHSSIPFWSNHLKLKV